ncbi:molybdopterin molybdotransferase MoeA [Halanaerobaculum tunisiense]
MAELFDLMTIDEALQVAEDKLETSLPTETVKITEADDRVLAQEIVSKVNVPPFSRSTMDGYAVKAEDTFGATETLPVYLEVIDRVGMGEEATQKIDSGQAVEVATGGMLPPGADAVVMVEYTEVVDENEIEVTTSVGVGENIVVAGEDISQGENLLSLGHQLRPQDIGALAGIGVTEVEVYTKPQVTVFSTGDELITPRQKPIQGQIRDINSYSIGGLVKQVGAVVDYGGIIPDDKEQLNKQLQDKVATSDLIILSGGSSVGVKDLTIEVLNELGDPGVVIHGVAIKPGKPTIIAFVDDTLIVGLPGHPTSAMVVFEIVVKPIIQKLVGFKKALPLKSQVTAKLTRNVASNKGRTEYLRVKLVDEEAEQLLAKPMLGKSSLITTMVEADGLIKVDLGSEGIKAGTEVEVLLF